MPAHRVVTTPSSTSPVSGPRIVAAAVLVSVTGVLPPILTGAIAVQLQEAMGLSERTVGLAFAGYFAVAAVTARWGGRLTDRIGWQRAVYVVGLLSLTLLAAMVASSGPLMLVPVLIAGGCVQGVAGAAGSVALGRGLAGRPVGLAFGVMQAAIPLAALVSGLLVPSMALVVGWRSVYLAAMAFPLAGMLAAGRYPPSHRGGTSAQAVRPTGAPVMRPSSVDVLPTEQHDVGVGDESADRGAAALLRRLAVAASVTSLANSTLGVFFVAAVVAAGVPEGGAGWALAAASGTALVVRVVGGWLLDARPWEGLRPTAILTSVAVVGFLLLASMQPAVMVVGGIVAYGAGWGWTGFFYHAIVARHADAPGAAVAVAQRGIAVGAAVGPLVGGQLIELGGFSLMWAFSAGVGLAGAALFHAGASAAQGRSPK